MTRAHSYAIQAVTCALMAIAAPASWMVYLLLTATVVALVQMAWQIDVVQPRAGAHLER